MSDKISTNVLIIGSGPAGYSAAVYAARGAANPVLIQGSQPGGQLTITTDVDNYIGIPSILGPDLMDQMKLHAEQSGARIINDHIVEIKRQGNLFICIGESKMRYESYSVIIATGAQAKFLGLENESFFQGHGVSGCAVCDGFFFRGKRVAIVGGGNTAAEEALYLTRHASEVMMIHRRDKFRAERILQDRIFANKKISILWNSQLVDILGDQEPIKKVTAIKVKNVNSNEISTLEIDGVFIAIGHQPNTDLVKNLLTLDSTGYITTKADSTITSVPGLFAAGDVRDPVYRQAISSAGYGCMAALDCLKYLESQNIL